MPRAQAGSRQRGVEDADPYILLFQMWRFSILTLLRWDRCAKLISIFGKNKETGPPFLLICSLLERQ